MLCIKISGCFNSCGQHYVVDIGFLGVSCNLGGWCVVYFQLVIGGEWANNGGSYGLVIGVFLSKCILEVVDCLIEYWIGNCNDGEGFQDYM